MKVLLLTFVIFLSLYDFAVTLECYTCSGSNQDQDSTCLDTPEQLATTDCDKEFCISIKEELKAQPGNIVSVYRGCEDNPPFTDGIIEDETHNFYVKACQQPLCNGEN